MKILYVEDNPQDAELARVALLRTKAATRVTCVESVSAALAELSGAVTDAYDLVLSDIHLPDGNGLDVLRHVREHGVPLAVVLITGATDDDAALAAMRASADDYVAKRSGYMDRLPRVLELALGRYRESANRRSRPLRVLYAEHNAYDIDLTRRHFFHAAPHLQLEVVPTGAQVLARLDAPQSGNTVDVLLLDYQLPGLSALDLTKELRQVRGLDLAIVIVTGHGGDDLALQCLRLGATDYVVKQTGYIERLPITIENAWYRTEMRRDQANLQRLAAFPEHSPSPVFELNAECRVTYHNHAAKELALTLGLLHPADLLPRDAAAQVQACLRTGKPVSCPEVVCGARILDWSYCPVAAQSVVHCYAEDMTQRHQLEERLRQSQKMEAIGQLAGGIAHDFNNLLTVIDGNAQLMRDGTTLDPAQRDGLEEITQAVERAAGLTRQLLAFSRRSTIQRTSLDLNEVVGQITKLLRRTLGELVILEVEPAHEPAMVSGDAGMLEQVLLNLALNARDAMTQAGGTLQLKTQVMDSLVVATSVSERDASASNRNGRFVVLTVKDDGAGIAPENLPRIFEPFFTTKEVGKGTGLGLSTVQGIVQQHGGFLRVQSTLGQGTAISVFLPELRAAPRSRDAARVGAGVIGGSETILVVEDETAVRSLVCRSLSRMGYRVIGAVDGSDAIEQHQRAGTVDLLLTDLIMPGGVSGLDVLRLLRAKQPRLPVVFTSGYEAQVLGTDFAYGERERFLAKPYELAQLYRLVREMLDLV